MAPMRIERDKLIWLALATLAEQVEQARAGPPPPSHGVRLALAVLHIFSSGDRAPFTEFWRQMRKDCLNTGTPPTASYCRSTYLQRELRGVMRAVGVDPCTATEMPLAQAALKVFPRHSEGEPS